MLSFLFPLDLREKHLNLGGSGDPKDKLMIGALVVIIAAAIFALVMSFISGGGPSLTVNKFHLMCVNPDCEHEWVLSRGEMIDIQKERRGGSPGMGLMDMFPSYECPQCTDTTGYTLTQCPNTDCEKWYLPDATRAHIEDPEAGMSSGMMDGGRQECPYCGIDIGQWHREHRPKTK